MCASEWVVWVLVDVLVGECDIGVYLLVSVWVCVLVGECVCWWVPVSECVCVGMGVGGCVIVCW